MNAALPQRLPQVNFVTRTTTSLSIDAVELANGIASVRLTTPLQPH